MKIESVEVIPMRGESIWEDIKNDFEVFGITTSYDEWEKVSANNVLLDLDNYAVTEECFGFAKQQQAFMTAPIAKFGDVLFVSRSRRARSLDGLKIDGPLYQVYQIEVDDIDAGKTVEREYIDTETFMINNGLWYPKKKEYVVRYGFSENVG